MKEPSPADFAVEKPSRLYYEAHIIESGGTGLGGGTDGTDKADETDAAGNGTNETGAGDGTGGAGPAGAAAAPGPSSAGGTSIERAPVKTDETSQTGQISQTGEISQTGQTPQTGTTGQTGKPGGPAPPPRAAGSEQRATRCSAAAPRIKSLCGRELHVRVHHFLREERAFPSSAALRRQIQKDIQKALKFFSLSVR